MSELVVLALLPVIAMIVLGHLMRRRAFLADTFWPQAERLSYYVLLPCLFIHSLSTGDLSSLPVQGLMATLVGAILLVSTMLLALRPLLATDGPVFTSIFQGSVRFNNYIGVSLAAGVFGTQGIALAALCNAIIVPTVNLLCVLVFARFGSSRLTLRGVLRQIATNPLLVACLIGAMMQLLGLHLPPGIDGAMKSLGAASMPIGLLCVGAALSFGSMGAWVRPLLISSASRFAVMPVVTLGLALLLGLDPVALMFQCMPTASSSYIMARQLGGDAPLMAGIVAVQTVAAGIAIPLVLAVLLV